MQRYRIYLQGGHIECDESSLKYWQDEVFRILGIVPRIERLPN